MAKNNNLILFIPSIEDGGVEKNLNILANYLANKLDNIYIITYKKSDNYKFNKKVKIITPFLNFFNFKGRYPKYIICLVTFLSIILFKRKSLVLSFQANIFVIIICSFFNIKIISRSNSSSAGWSKNPIKQSIFKYYFKRANKIVVNSFEFKKEMDNKFNIDTICILNPFNFKEIKKLSKIKVKKIFNSNKIKLINVGRLTDQKDQLTILQAIKKCERKDIELVIIGKGKNENKLKNFCLENRLDKKVKFIGYKKNPFKYIKQADIFILSSLYEGSPNVLVEALFLKKYIISTDCPTGPREILNNGEFGELVKMNSPTQIAKLIDNFSKDKINKKKIEKGFKSLRVFDYNLNCKKYLELIQNFF